MEVVPSNRINVEINQLKVKNQFLKEKMCENCIYDDNMEIFQEIKTNEKQIQLLERLKN